MGATQTISSQDFDQNIVGGKGVAVVDFTATWCGPCQALAPALDQIAADYEGKALVVKVDVDKEPDLAARMNVMSVPTVMIFKDGQVVDSVQGNFPDRIKSKIDELL